MDKTENRNGNEVIITITAIFFFCSDCNAFSDFIACYRDLTPKQCSDHGPHYKSKLELKSNLERNFAG